VPGKLKHELGRIEQAILDLQTKKHALEARLSTTQSPQEIGAIGSELQQIDGELAAQEDRWLDVSAQIEAATA
jgi:ATP-binding cassette subfamily F protein 3